MSTTEAPVSFIPKSPAEATKAILVIAVTLFAFVRASLADGFTPVEGLQFVIQGLTLLPVFILTGTAVKTVAAFALAGLQALVVPFSVLVGWNAWGQVSFDDWAGAILAAFLAIGIAVIPNAKPTASPIVANTFTVSNSTRAELAAAEILGHPLEVPGPDHRAE